MKRKMKRILEGDKMGKKQIALIGAGKLGKGYVADLFGKAGYEVIFLARRQQQVDTMRRDVYKRQG